MTAREMAIEIGDLFRTATALEEADQFPDAIAAYDLATQLLTEFTTEVNRQLVAVHELFDGPEDPSCSETPRD